MCDSVSKIAFVATGDGEVEEALVSADFFVLYAVAELEFKVGGIGSNDQDVLSIGALRKLSRYNGLELEGSRQLVWGW